MSVNRSRFFLPLILLSFFYLYCAKISSPPGGPIDKTDPSVISTIPRGDSINIPGDDKISIRFSENINKKTIDGAIFISPRFSGETKYKWKSQTLNIILPDSFADSTTYIVNVGASVSDLRGNKMENSFIFAFSTGDKINKGRISGAVFKDSKPYPNASIGLFEFLRPDSLTQFDSTYPPYLTQSGKSGEYSFEYIPDGEFFVIAFNDKNKDQLFNYPQEIFGLPDRIADVSVDRGEPDIDFFMQEEDTAAIEILSTTITADRLLKVRFSSKVSSDSLRENRNKIYLEPAAAGQPVRNPSAIKQRSGLLSSTFQFYFDNIIEGVYRLKIDADIFGRHPDSIRTIESAEFTITADTDKTPPEIDSVSHLKKIISPTDSVIEIFFSEPIRDQLAKDAFSIIDSDSSLYNIKIRRPDRFALSLFINDLKWNKNYTMTVIESLIVDLSGNRLGDSIRQYEFATYDLDSLGSVSGTITLEPSVDTTAFPYIKFISPDRKFVYEERVLTGHFDFPLPPGKYFLSGFLDKNNNGLQDYGSLFPFHYAETAAFYPDTIRVRARFETTGIELIVD